MIRVANRAYFLSDDERNKISNTLREISENISRTQKIIRAVDDTIIILNNIPKPNSYGWSARLASASAWNELIFGKSDRRNYSEQAKRNVADMKFLMDVFTNSLKNISSKIPEYNFNDYGIDKEFADFHSYCEKTEFNKIKNYEPDKDVEILTNISAKAAKIKHDLNDLKEKISMKFHRKT